MKDTQPGSQPQVIVLSDAQIDAIAEKVEDRFYLRVGKNVVEKVLWLIGLGTAALFAWLASRGDLTK